MKALLRKNLKWFAGKLRSDTVDSYSAQISFFMIIAFLPFLMLLLSILQSVHMTNGMSLLFSMLDLLPESVSGYVKELFPRDREPFAVISLSAVACLWSSSRATLCLIKGLDSVFDAPEHRGIFRLRLVAVLYTLVFAVMLVFSVLLLVFGNAIFERLFGGRVSLFLSGGRSLTGFGVLTVFFTFSFRVLPLRSGVSLKHCFVGGCLAALGWVGFSSLFSLYVANFADYSAVYGSLAALVIFMLWLYFCMYLTFLGAETAVWLESGPIRADWQNVRARRNLVKQNRRNRRILK